MTHTELPITHLRPRHLALPFTALALAVFIVAAVLVTYLGVQPNIWTHLDGCTSLKLALGFVAFVAGFSWLAHSWRPGAGKPTDFIIPWLCLGAVLVAGLIQPRSEMGATAMAEIVLLSLPFLIGFTLLTRLQAPTDLCSASNAIGFTAGGAAVMLYALHCPLTDTPTVLLWYGMALAITALISRTILCRFIQW